MSGVDYLIERLEKEYNSFPLLNSDECIKAKQIELSFITELWDYAFDSGYNFGSESGESNIANRTLEDFMNEKRA